MTAELTPMQTELLKRSDAIMDSLGKTISTAVDFSKEQIPDIAYQYIAFERAYSTFSVLIGVGILACVYFLIKKMIDKWDNWDIDMLAPLSGLCVLLSFIGSVTLGSSIKGFFLVWFAPKVFLLQSLTSLLKG